MRCTEPRCPDLKINNANTLVVAFKGKQMACTFVFLGLSVKVSQISDFAHNILDVLLGDIDFNGFSLGRNILSFMVLIKTVIK